LLEDGDEGAPHGERGAVQGVEEARLGLGLGAVADLGAAGLEIAEVGAARDLAVEALAGEPGLEVVGALGGEAHVAGAEQADPVVELEALEYLLGVAGEELGL